MSMWRLVGLMVVLVGRAGNAWGQAPPTWAWAVAPGRVEPQQVTTDAAGNVYVAGTFTDTATFGAFTLASEGINDVFVTKYTPGGVCQWAVRAGSPAVEVGMAVAVDGNGNVYVSGIYNGAVANFGSAVVTQSCASCFSNFDSFVAKLSPTGVWQWATSPRCGQNDYARGLAVDGSGDVYVTGEFNASAVFGSTTLTGSTGFNDSNLFVAKLTPGGTWQWAIALGSTGTSHGNAIKVAATGDVLTTGYFTGPIATFGATTLTNSTTSPNLYESFVASLSPNGVWQWAVRIGGVKDENGLDLVTDGGGNAYVIGNSSSPTVTFGSLILTNMGVLGTTNTSDIFVAKLSPAGVWQWATSAGGRSSDFGEGIAVDGGGNVYVTGYFGGQEDSTATFGFTTLTTLRPRAGASDLFVAKLASVGTWQWAVHAGSPSNDAGNSVALDGSGNIYVGGICWNGGVFDSITLAARGGFIGRLSQHPQGIAPDGTSAALSLAPNPAHHAVRLTGVLTQSPTATLLDALGRVVRTWPLAPAGPADLDLRGLPAGLYTVRAGTAARRLIVE